MNLLMEKEPVMESEFVSIRTAEFKNLDGFRNRLREEKKEKLYEEAFRSIVSYANIVANLPAFLQEVFRKDVSLEEKETEIRAMLDLITRVQKDETSKFNIKVNQAKGGVKL